MGQVRLVRTLQDAAGNVSQSLVGQDYEAGQIRLKVPTLAPVLQELTVKSKYLVLYLDLFPPAWLAKAPLQFTQDFMRVDGVMA